MRKRPTTTPTSLGWWFIALFAILLIVAMILLLVMYPYPVDSYYRETSPTPIDHKDHGVRENCTRGEEYDEELELCGPIVHVPIPIDTQLMNTSVGPCTSFFHNQVGGWISTHTNENRGFTYVYRRNQKQIHDLIRSPDSGPIYTFYRSCLDTLVNKQHQILDQAQMRHVREHILEALRSHADLPIVFARLASYGFNSPMVITIESHPTETAMVPLIHFEDWQPTTIPKALDRMREWIAADDVNFPNSFVEYVHSSLYEQHMMNMGALFDVAPNNFWKLYLRELNGYGMEEDLEAANRPVWVITPKYIRAFLANMNSIPLHEWKEYVERSIEWNTANFVPDLPSDSYFRKHEWNPLIVRMPPHRLPRRRRSPDQDPGITEHDCLSITHRLLPGVVGQTFLQRFMPNYKSLQSTVTKVVENVRDAYADLIQETSWMDPETRHAAVKKIRAIMVRSVHPTHWETEPFAERMTADCYLRNLNIIRRYRATRNFELWTRTEPNRDFIQRFSAPLTEVNAFYSPITNTITVFAGILREPFFSPQFAEVAMYATIGMIAGHELGHAMDPNGRQYDHNGNIRQWWTTKDEEEFNQRAQCIMEEYPAPPGCANDHYGQQTIGEDMSDIVGIKSAYNAYFKGKERSEDEKKQFFSVFAQMWAESYDSAHLCELVSDDEHAIAWFRVDKTLRNLREFQHTYGCKKDDPMVHKKPCVVYGE
jgi:predicted metalloendopeptidase